MTGGPNGFPAFALQFDASLIPALASRYSYPAEGRVADEIGPAVRERGYFTRSELIEVCAWKTARSRSRVAANTDEEVREATWLALSAAGGHGAGSGARAVPETFTPGVQQAGQDHERRRTAPARPPGTGFARGMNPSAGQ